MNLEVGRHGEIEIRPYDQRIDLLTATSRLCTRVFEGQLQVYDGHWWYELGPDGLKQLGGAVFPNQERKWWNVGGGNGAVFVVGPIKRTVGGRIWRTIRFPEGDEQTRDEQDIAVNSIVLRLVPATEEKTT